jgi:hypothetical protein
VVQGHQIEVAPARNGPWEILVANQEYDTGDNATLTYTHMSLTAGTQYCYRISGINSAGVGLASEEECGTTAAAALPAVPMSVKANAVSPTRIDVSWNASPDPAGAPVIGYKIEYSTDNSLWVLLTANTEEETSDTTDAIEVMYSDTSVTAGQTRYYRVSAINSAGTSSPSTVDDDAMATTPGTDAVITAPTNVQVSVSGSSITVTWTEGTGPAGLKHDVGLFTRDLSRFVAYSIDDSDGTHTFDTTAGGDTIADGDYLVFVAAYTTPDDAESSPGETFTVGSSGN